MYNGMERTEVVPTRRRLCRVAVDVGSSIVAVAAAAPRLVVLGWRR